MSSMKSINAKLNQITKKLQNDINKSLSTTIAKDVIKEEKEVIDMYIYDAPYERKMYKNRSSGGLSDENNYVSNVANVSDKTTQLTVSNVTMANPEIRDMNNAPVGHTTTSKNAGKYLLPIIENQEYDFPGGDYDYEKDIRKTTVERLVNKNVIVDDLKKDLASKGWNVK